MSPRPAGAGGVSSSSATSGTEDEAGGTRLHRLARSLQHALLVGVLTAGEQQQRPVGRHDHRLDGLLRRELPGRAGSYVRFLGDRWPAARHWPRPRDAASAVVSAWTLRGRLDLDLLDLVLLLGLEADGDGEDSVVVARRDVVALKSPGSGRLQENEPYRNSVRCLPSVLSCRSARMVR